MFAWVEDLRPSQQFSVMSGRFSLVEQFLAMKIKPLAH